MVTTGNDNMAKIKDAAPRPVSFGGLDKIVIVCLVAVFLALFVWLLAFKQDQPFYSYLTFLCVLTLVFVGILRAAGVFRTSLMVLSGAAGVFAGLFLLTERFQDQSEQIKRFKMFGSCM